MPKTRSDVIVQRSGLPVAVLRPANEIYLRGDRPTPVLDTLWEGWLPIGAVLIAIGAAIIVALVMVFGYIAVWNSPLGVETMGTVDGYDGTHVEYHYEADGVRYDKREPVNRSTTAWRSGDAPEPVVYLSFQPAESRLAFNVEGMDWGMAAFALIFAGILPFSGWLLRRRHLRMIELRDEATHVLEGKVTNAISTRSGMQTFFYTATSPDTGRDLRGSVNVGRLSTSFGRIAVGSNVAVLYRHDDLHAIL